MTTDHWDQGDRREVFRGMMEIQKFSSSHLPPLFLQVGAIATNKFSVVIEMMATKNLSSATATHWLRDAPV